MKKVTNINFVVTCFVKKQENLLEMHGFLVQIQVHAQIQVQIQVPCPDSDPHRDPILNAKC